MLLIILVHPTIFKLEKEFSQDVILPVFMKTIQKSLHGVVRSTVPAVGCLAVVRMRT